MRCKKCKQTACFQIRRHNAAFCEEHFVEHLQNQVVRAIKKFKMFPREEKILLAVSGGKDSLALWDMLIDMGYSVDGLYIDLGIPDYSDVSGQKTRNFAESRGLVLHEVSLSRAYNVDIGHIARKNKKPPCSVCGVLKRYVMNMVAERHGYFAVATGHNLDDEAAVLMGNVLNWQTEYLQRQSPLLEAKPGMARKVKPLFRLAERETAAYCVLRGIDYIMHECPMSEGATSFTYKEVLNRLEWESPGSKDQFLLGFLRTAPQLFPQHSSDDGPDLQPCTRCGQLTTTGECGFCRQMARAGLDSLALFHSSASPERDQRN
jgi:uncharacterized protein (TIGR00269 family)